MAVTFSHKLIRGGEEIEVTVFADHFVSDHSVGIGLYPEELHAACPDGFDILLMPPWFGCSVLDGLSGFDSRSVHYLWAWGCASLKVDRFQSRRRIAPDAETLLSGV